MEEKTHTLSCFYFPLFLEQIVGFYFLPLAIQANELFADVMCVASNPAHSSAVTKGSRASFFILHRNQQNSR